MEIVSASVNSNGYPVVVAKFYTLFGKAYHVKFMNGFKAEDDAPHSGARPWKWKGANGKRPGLVKGVRLAEAFDFWYKMRVSDDHG